MGFDKIGAWVASSAVERFSDLRVAGAKRAFSSSVERFSDKEEVDGPTPSVPTAGFGKARKEEVDGPTPSSPTLIGKYF